MERPGKRWEGGRNGRAGYLFPWLPHWRVHHSSEGLGSCQEALSVCHNCSPSCPLRSRVVMELHYYQPWGHCTISIPVVFFITLWVIKLSSKYPNLRMPSVSCWVSLIQISFPQISHPRKAISSKKRRPGYRMQWYFHEWLTDLLSCYFSLLWLSSQL